VPSGLWGERVLVALGFCLAGVLGDSGFWGEPGFWMAVGFWMATGFEWQRASVAAVLVAALLVAAAFGWRSAFSAAIKGFP